MNSWLVSTTSILRKKKRSSGSDLKHPPARGLQGFSEDALRGLDDLEARLPPPDIETKPAFTPSFKKTQRLSKDAAAGGGLLIDGEGNKVPHYWGHRERLRTRFLKGGHAPMPEYEILDFCCSMQSRALT